MKRAVLLQICPTWSKKDRLTSSLSLATSEFNRLWDDRDFCSRFMDFHRKVYSGCKKRTSFNSQVVCDIERSAWRSKNKSKGITIKFNVPRNSKYFDLSMPFVRFSLFSNNPISVPIVKNRNFQRYSGLLKSGWACKTYGLTSRLEVVAYLNKDSAKIPRKRNVLGIDVNSKCFAVSVVSPEGKILHQGYFGKDVWGRRRKLFERKSILQGYADVGSGYANKALRRTKRDEHNFVKNRIGEVVRDITEMALRYDADVSIENLKRFSPKGKRFNKEVMRIPFFTFKKNLISRCFDKDIYLDIVDAWHTSKFCSHCGAVGKGHDGRNYAMFRCECGVVVNSDRNASLNIAIKSLLVRKDSTNHKTFLFTNRRVSVNGLMRSDEVGLPNVAVQHANQSRNAPLLAVG